MITRAFVVLLLTSPSLWAQDALDYHFAQLADTQFGAFTDNQDFVQETANYEFAVANLNRLQPAFVVICGDLIDLTGDAEQRAEYFRITAKLDPSIPVYAVAGNHDVGNEPTPDSLTDYRRHFGPDYYAFEEPGIYGIVLNSSLIAAPETAPAEAAAQEAWLDAELVRAQASGAPHILVFQHHSWFLNSPDEETSYFNIPIEQRSRYLAKLKAAGVSHVFAGHYHRNAFGTDGELQMITSGPVGRPLGDDPSGFRIVHVTDDSIEHEYYGLGFLPNQLRPRQAAPNPSAPDPVAASAIEPRPAAPGQTQRR